MGDHRRGPRGASRDPAGLPAAPRRTSRRIRPCLVRPAARRPPELAGHAHLPGCARHGARRRSAPAGAPGGRVRLRHRDPAPRRGVRRDRRAGAGRPRRPSAARLGPAHLHRPRPGTDPLPGPDVRHPAAGRRRDPVAVPRDQPADDGGPGDRPAARPPAPHRPAPHPDRAPRRPDGDGPADGADVLVELPCCTSRSSRSLPWGSRHPTSPGVWPPRSGTCRRDVPSESAPEVARVQAALDAMLQTHVTVGFDGLASTPDRLGLG